MSYPECESCGTRLIPESMHCPGCGVPVSHPIPTEMRCMCGFLLCKLLEEAIEIKCRRCKRLVYIPVDDLPEHYEDNRRKMQEQRLRTPGDNVRGSGEKGQYCTKCGKYKPNVIYGKCLDCRTKSIKVQYKGRTR